MNQLSALKTNEPLKKKFAALTARPLTSLPTEPVHNVVPHSHKLDERLVFWQY